MKFKVGDKVSMLKEYCCLPKGHIGYVTDFYGNGFVAVHFGNLVGAVIWIPTRLLKLISRREEEPMTLQDKLKLFKAGTHVLHTPTQEIYDKLMVELEEQGYGWPYGNRHTNHWEENENETCISIGKLGLECSCRGYYEMAPSQGVLELTPADFPEIAQVTIIGDSSNPCEILIKAKVTKDGNGYTIEKLAEPKFAVGDFFESCRGNVGKITRMHNGHYEYQWSNGDRWDMGYDEFDRIMKKVKWDK